MDRKARIRESVYKSFQALESNIQVENPDTRLVFDNQKEAGFEIFEHFYDDIMAVTLLALPQVGKTGVMLWISYLMTTTLADEMSINPKNIYIISGMNDTDWKIQTKASFPEALNEHVYTRSEFNKISTLNSLENALIIIDECHIAAEERQQLSKKLAQAGLNTPESLREKNVRILQVSATPAHTLFNADRIWGEDHAVVRLVPSPKYIGFEQLLVADRIMDTEHMTPLQLFTEIKNQIKLIYKTPKYHIIRLGRGDSKVFYEMVSSNSWLVKTHNSESREDTDLLFETPPIQHTFLVIKGFWRAGKRLNDQHIGIMYEGPSNISDTNVVAQSLAGRACGNDKQMPLGDSPMIYCHRESIVEYINWAKGDGSFENKNYQSRHLRTTEKGDVNVRSSFHGTGFHHNVCDYAISESTFDTVEDARAWCQKNLTYGCSEHKLRNAEGKLGGFTHFRYRRETRPIKSEIDTREYSDNGVGVKDAARIMPVTDNSNTLEETGELYISWRKDKPRKVVSDAETRSSSDLGLRTKDSARIMPVDPDCIRYIVIYRKDKIKSN